MTVMRWPRGSTASRPALPVRYNPILTAVDKSGSSCGPAASGRSD